MLRKAAYVLSLAAVLTLPGQASAQASRAFFPAHHGGASVRRGVSAAPRFGPVGRFGRPVFHPLRFHRVPLFPHRFRPFVRFRVVVPFYAPYYPYNPYCDPGSIYYYPPWCY